MAPSPAPSSDGLGDGLGGRGPAGGRRGPEHVPTAPRRRAAAPPPIAGRYKVEPADFTVEEIPAYEPSGEGEHLWLWVEKRGIATMDLLPRLARALGIAVRDVGYAGLKDAKAVTRQWLSVPARVAADVESAVAAAQDLADVAVQRAVRHGNKLKIGHLKGNRFRIVLRDSDPAELAGARAHLADLERRGVPNWFGEQRFGNHGGNLDKGLGILRGTATGAGHRALPRRLLRLMVSAVQSEVFNRVLVDRVDTLGTLENGDVAWLHRNGASFAVVDAAAEQPRCDGLELSPSGPMPGPRMLAAEGAQGQREAAALAALGVDHEAFGRVPHKLTLGERRPLRVPLWEPRAAVEDGCVVLEFGLPRGSYATAVLRELLRDAPWFASSA